MKKILAVLLCAMLLMGLLSACGDNNNNYVTYPTSAPSKPLDLETLKGSWTLDANPNMDAAASYAEIFGEFETDAKIKSTYIFGDDGELTIRYQEDDLEDYFDMIVDDLREYLLDGGMYIYAEDEGISKEELDEMLEEEGLTMTEFVDLLLAGSEEEFEEIVEIMCGSKGYYDAVGTYTLSEGVLTVTVEGEDYAVKCTYDGKNSVHLTDVDEETPLNDVTMTKIEE